MRSVHIVFRSYCPRILWDDVARSYILLAIGDASVVLGTFDTSVLELENARPMMYRADHRRLIPRPFRSPLRPLRMACSTFH
jgi:hypothetical protein